MNAAWGFELFLITLAAIAPNALNSLGLKFATSVGKIGPLPAPSAYLATFIIFAPLSVLGTNPKFSTLASVIGWGFVLATLLSVIDPTDPLNPNVKGGSLGAQGNGTGPAPGLAGTPTTQQGQA